MNREKLIALIGKKEARKSELMTKANTSEDVKELRNINSELETLNCDIAELRSMLDALPDNTHNGGVEGNSQANSSNGEQRGMMQGGLSSGQFGNSQGGAGSQGNNSQHPETEQRGTAPQGQLNPIGTYGFAQGQMSAHQRTAEAEDRFATLEYRRAFMRFATSGEITPELRADTVTTTADVSAVIPSTILNEVIKKVTIYGQVFSRVRKTNIKGGVTVPILSLKPTATWIGETTPSDKQKAQINTNVTFSYYGLECKIATSLLADTVTLTGFENIITDLIVEAMVKAIDLSVISGDGIGKAKGITADDRVPAANVITLASTDFISWEAWKKKVFAKMPLAYKAGATFLMASGTFEGYIDGMVDTNGQPIGRVNYGITNGAQERFGGKEVIQVEDDVIAPYDDAATGAVVAVYCNLNNYVFNSNMQMTMFRYFDHDKNEWIDKAILIADGKLLDPNGVVIIKKGA